MSDAARTAVIQEHYKELKLAAVVRDYPALCRQARTHAATLLPDFPYRETHNTFSIAEFVQ